MVSIIIPSCNEIFLQKTIDSILENATGEIEVIAYLDGYWPKPPIKDDPRVILVHDPIRRGRRFVTNASASIAKGKYLMKVDAHCAFSPGFDKVLSESCDSDWVVTPRRYSLDVEKWGIEDNGKVRDAHYLSYPTAFVEKMGFGMHIKDWPERGAERAGHMIDDEMVSQGSAWLMHREYFRRLDQSMYGIWEQDWQEIGLRVWMSGGRCVINKNAWYAHLWKGKRFGRMYDLDRAECKQSIINSTDYWFNNRMPGAVRNIEWFIDKFWPVPTWPKDWKGKVIQMPEVKMFSASPEQKPAELFAVKIKAEKSIDAEAYIMRKFNLSGTGRLGIPNWTRQDMARLFCELGFKKGAEIGTFQGEFARQMCDSNPGLDLTCVDIWGAYNDYTDPTSKSDLDNAYSIARSRLEKRGCTLIRKASLDAAKDIPDESLDFVYIDANHRYEFVVADLAAWSKKVRKGGIISGHDYKKFDHHTPDMCVKEAVDGYVSAYEIPVWFIFQTNLVDRIRNRCGSYMWVKR